MDINTLQLITATIAGTCMAICQVPQAWKIYKEGKAEGLSLSMQIIITTGIFFWFVTGVLLRNIPMWVSNGFCLIFCIYVLVMVIRTHKREKQNQD